MPGAEPTGNGSSLLEWRSDDEFAIDGIEYACRELHDFFESTPVRFCIRKPREQVERYDALLRRLRPRTIVEAGVYEGGSTAFMAQAASPDKLVCFDIEARREGLEEMVRARGLGDIVRPHWGVDQADGERLRRIVDDELGERPLELMVDDASHLLEPTRATFNALFPLLPPGGVYVVEDWAWAHSILNPWRHRVPLTALVFELIMAAGHRPGAVATVEVDRAWAVITRGPDPIDRETFDIREHCGVRGLELIAGVDEPPAPGTPPGPRIATRLFRRARRTADRRRRD